LLSVPMCSSGISDKVPIPSDNQTPLWPKE
jgi:hypothetical protein